jgi:hypothetical protein
VPPLFSRVGSIDGAAKKFAGYRWFESISLQERVHCELGPRGPPSGRAMLTPPILVHWNQHDEGRPFERYAKAGASARSWRGRLGVSGRGPAVAQECQLNPGKPTVRQLVQRFLQCQQPTSTEPPPNRRAITHSAYAPPTTTTGRGRYCEAPWAYCLSTRGGG